jgi:hypothetical protein
MQDNGGRTGVETDSLGQGLLCCLFNSTNSDGGNANIC